MNDAPRSAVEAFRDRGLNADETMLALLFHVAHTHIGQCLRMGKKGGGEDGAELSFHGLGGSSVFMSISEQRFGRR